MTEAEEKKARQKETILQYSEMVYRLAYSLVKDRYDADDIYQEVFTNYIRKNPQFQSGEHEKAWFLRVTVNCCKNFWKSAWQSRTEGLVEMVQKKGLEETGTFRWQNREDMLAGTEESTDKEAQNLAMIEQVKLLPEKYRIVIHLFYYEDMSVEEIGKALKSKPSTIRTQLTRARRLLKKRLKEEV